MGNRPRRPCSFEEDGDDAEMHDDYFEHQRNEAEDRTWQHHENNCTDDQLFAEAARVAMEDAKKRSGDMKAAADIPDFIKAINERQR